MSSPFARLSSPIALGHTTAKNRIVSTPHGAAFGEKGSITERYVRYHEEKAKGGCGVVMMFGSSSIHPTSINDWGEVNNWDDGVIPQFREMSAAIHRHGALCLSQISHRGRRGHSWYSGTPLWAPSDTREERHREWPHVMTKAEIREVIDAWAAAAVRLKKGGYDGADIPLYGGHLLENFISPLANTRTDEYGGSLDNRLRLPTEVLRALREAVGRDFILGLRHSGDHFVPGELTREELLEIARRLDALGIADYWMVSGSNTETLKHEAAVTPSHYHPRGVFNDLAALTKSVVRVPVIVAGRIVTAEQAEAALAAGVCDLVGMTRALIADPEMPKKVSEGRVDDVRVCVGAAEGCIGRLRQGKSITCVQNPAIGREAELVEIRPASSPRREVVTGRTAPGRGVVVVDEEGYFAAPTTADFLAERGAQVTIVCRYFMVGEDIDEGTRSDLYARLFARGVTLIPMTVAREILPQGVRTRHTFSNAEATLAADSVVLAFGGKANDPLSRELEGKVADLKVIGDAYSPRRVHDAILDGTRVARTL